MALVKLQNDWFAPYGAYAPDSIRRYSGQLFERGRSEVNDGWVEIPDELIEFLPRTAKVAPREEGVPPKVDVPKPPSIQEFDEERAASDAYIKVVEQAQKNRDKK